MTENIDNDEKGAAVKFPPPLIFLLSILSAYGIHYLKPLNIGASLEVKIVGILMILLALAAIAYISRIFSKAQTSIEPWKPTIAIISTGFYAWSRNPIYVIFCFATVGLGLLLDSYWVLLSFLPSAVLVYFIAIRKEEAYLERKFGEEYLLYKKRVRRWL